jgi:hypothetical protein
MVACHGRARNARRARVVFVFRFVRRQEGRVQLQLVVQVEAAQVQHLGDRRHGRNRPSTSARAD